MSPRALVAVALAALVVALLLLFVALPQLDFSRPAPPSPPPPPVETAAPVAPPPHFGEVCARHQSRICDGSNVFWQDGCGRREELAQKCDDCQGGQCVAAPSPSPPPYCAGLSEGGHCDGDILRWCDEGKARAYDCAPEFHCARGSDGEPNCFKRIACAGDSCNGSRGRVCEGGWVRSFSCGKESQCELDINHHARCVRRLSLEWLKGAPCQGCACPSPEPEALLPPIPIVALITVDDSGVMAETEERVQKEVAQLDNWFAPTGLRFFLKEVKKVPGGPSFVYAENGVVRWPELEHPPEQPFFVPVVFVPNLKVGVKTTPGVATLPGGVCADLVPLPSSIDDTGGIIIARRRNPTTLAHELGHYFGLCHTHQPDPSPPRFTLREDGTPLECAACGASGDGVCDTPTDPGLDACTLDEQRCTVTCANGATPDPTNLMSYFVPCRRVFSAEQTAYLRRYARLRMLAHTR